MSESITISANDFIETVKEKLQGFGFTPLIGSGMSAASGIVMGMQFSEYLAYSVYMAFTQGWDFRVDGWPPFPAYPEYEKAREWVYHNYVEICKRYGVEIDADPDVKGRVKKISLAAGRGQSSDVLTAALNMPPVPAAIRSPAYRCDEEDSLRLADTLRRYDGSKAPYNPLWPLVEMSATSKAY